MKNQMWAYKCGQIVHDFHHLDILIESLETHRGLNNDLLPQHMRRRGCKRDHVVELVRADCERYGCAIETDVAPTEAEVARLAELNAVIKLNGKTDDLEVTLE